MQSIAAALKITPAVSVGPVTASDGFTRSQWNSGTSREPSYQRPRVFFKGGELVVTAETGGRGIRPSRRPRQRVPASAAISKVFYFMESESAVDLPDLIVIDDADEEPDQRPRSQPCRMSAGATSQFLLVGKNASPQVSSTQTDPPFTRQEALAAFETILRGLISDHDDYVNAFLDKAQVAATLFKPSQSEVMQRGSIMVTEQQLHEKFVKVIEQIRANLDDHPILPVAKEYFEAKVLDCFSGSPDLDSAALSVAKMKNETLRKKKEKIVEQKEAELAALTAEEERLDAEIAQLTARVESLEQSGTSVGIEALQNQMRALEEELRKEKEKSSKEADEIKAAIKTREAEIQEANEKLQRMRDQRERASRHRYRTDEQSRRYAKLSAEIDKLRAECAELRSAPTDGEDEAATRRIAELQKELSEAEEEKRRQQAALEEAERELASTEQWMAQCEGKKDGIAREIRNAEAELEVQEKVLEDLLILTQVKTGTEAPNGNLDEKLSYVLKHLETIVQEYQKLREKETKLSTELENFLQTYPQVELLIRQKDTHLESLKRQIESKENEAKTYNDEADARIGQLRNFLLTVAYRRQG